MSGGLVLLEVIHCRIQFILKQKLVVHILKRLELLYLLSDLASSFVRLKISLASDKWFDESEPGLSLSIFKLPARRMLSYLVSILFKAMRFHLKT